MWNAICQVSSHNFCFFQTYQGFPTSTQPDLSSCWLIEEQIGLGGQCCHCPIRVWSSVQGRSLLPWTGKEMVWWPQKAEPLWGVVWLGGSPFYQRISRGLSTSTQQLDTNCECGLPALHTLSISITLLQCLLQSALRRQL